MKKILVTGAGGYLGSTLCTELVQKGFEVTGIDNFFFKKDTLKHLYDKKNFDFHNFDVREDKLYTEFVPKNDLIIPLAGIVGAPMCDKHHELAFEVNEQQIKKISDITSKDQAIIYPTTNSGYGTTSKHVICTEEMDLNPISHYGRTKVNAEKYLFKKENAISLRLATVFGVSYRNRIDLLVNFFVYNAVKFKKIKLFEPNFRRNYIHVKDVAYTIQHCIDNFSKMKSNVYNVGLSEANLTKLELCEQIKSFISEFEITVDEHGKDPDKRDYFVSNKKLEKTNWKPKITLKQGINELINFYKKLDEKEFDKNY